MGHSVRSCRVSAVASSKNEQVGGGSSPRGRLVDGPGLLRWRFVRLQLPGRGPDPEQDAPGWRAESLNYRICLDHAGWCRGEVGTSPPQMLRKSGPLKSVREVSHIAGGDDRRRTSASYRMVVERTLRDSADR